MHGFHEVVQRKMIMDHDFMPKEGGSMPYEGPSKRSVMHEILRN